MQTVTIIPKLPARPADGHKGTFGRVLVIGGSEDMIGAPVLAGLAALRMGSGLVQIAVPWAHLGASISIGPELVGLGLRGAADDRKLMAAADAADAIVLGPGMGQGRDAARRVSKLIRMQKPMVIDADALNLLSVARRWPKEFVAQAVLTPHPGEMARLGKLIGRESVPKDQEGRIEIATAAAKSFGQIVVLKGHRTVVTDGERVYVNQSGDSTLAKAGSGDILSGMIGCLLGQVVDWFDAAVLGVHLHGLAGEAAGKKLGQRCALARDVIDAIPQVVAQYEARA